jgi:hypothetical protein
MLYISAATPSCNNDDKRQLARLRRAAMARGFRKLLQQLRTEVAQ